jgi:hypothetical protein
MLMGMGRDESRPYEDEAVDMIRHDDERIDIDGRKPDR